MPLGTLIFSLARPAPVTAIHPSPVKEMSAAASLQPAPSISRVWESNSPISAILSGPGSNGGVNIFPACFEVNSSARLESVGCNFISLATKNVKRKGLLSPITSIFASPPTKTHFPVVTRKVIGSICFLGQTILSSSWVSSCVMVPGTRSPGVSYIVWPSPRSILMNFNVVPGKGEVVRAPFSWLRFPGRIFLIVCSSLFLLFLLLRLKM